MRWAAKAGPDKLEWSILDIEQDEWERRLAEPGVAAAANGFPLYPAAAPAALHCPSAAVHIRWQARHVLVVAVLGILAVLAGGLAGGLAGYGVWRSAQAGIVRMQDDVANAVKLENIHALAERPARMPHESVQAVEFLDNAALATVMVTRTVEGNVYVQPELRFYRQTSQGWQRSDPIAAFWGPTATLDTAHLHFVFGRRDQAAVAAAAPGAEATYVLLRRAAGVELAPGGRTSIEIVAGSFAYDRQLGDGRLRLTSPALYMVPAQARASMLNRLLRLVLVDRLMAAAARKSPARAQWQPLVRAFATWLESSTAIGFAPGDEAPLLRRQVLPPLYRAWRLADLQEAVLRYDPASQAMVDFTLIGGGERHFEREAAAVQLLDFIAAHYGMDVLPRLLAGFAQYEDWEELAPAVLGVSAAELERAWHAGNPATLD